MRHIVIIGGGFGGLTLLKNLAGAAGFEITLVDKNNYNFFPPLLYQVATGFLEVSNISYPYRMLMRKWKNARFHLAELLSVVPEENKILLSTGEMSYDHLVFATGAATNYFGLENVEKNALPMKTLDDAIELRNHLLLQMEAAAILPEGPEKRKHLNIVVAGAGPTGIEISGMLADIRKTIFPKDYPEIAGNSPAGHIYLVSSTEVVLKPMSGKSQTDALSYLKGMGVDVLLQVQVKDYDGEKITLSNGDIIESKTLVWATGVAGLFFGGMPRSSYSRGNRLIVDAYNKVAGFENIYAIGDCCAQQHEKNYPNGHPQLAQPAIQQGKNLARNLQRREAGLEQRVFSYWDKGSMAIIGRNKAVLDLAGNKGHFRGFSAWVMWLFVHMVSLVTAKNMVTTFFKWTTAYFSRDQSLRMIIRPGIRKERSVPSAGK